MSLRIRLFLVVVLAAVALGAAGSAIYHVLTSTERARLDAARKELGESLDMLEASFSELRVASLADAGPKLAPSGRDRGGALQDSLSGFCFTSGAPIGEGVPPVLPDAGGPRSQALPPDQHDALVVACRVAATGAIRYATLVHPHDTVLIATRKIAGDGSVWALRRVQTPSAELDGRWKLDVALLSLATVLLVGFTASAAVGLASGMRTLEGSLGKLQVDLRAPIDEPRTAEFSRLTAGLRDMAMHLARAQSREGELMRDLAHRDRLAALGRVVAGVAHEIRNPLAGIKLKLDVLERGTDADANVRASVKACLSEIVRLDRVVQSLLAVSRKTERKPEALALAELADERARLLRGGAAPRSISMVREGEGMVTGDRDELSRIIDNLLRNAIDASPDGGSIVIRVRDAESRVSLAVIDEGAGIPAERIGELFEPFFTTKAEGTGLGLWLSRALVEAQGGTLVYERREGTTFFEMTLPENRA